MKKEQKNNWTAGKMNARGENGVSFCVSAREPNRFIISLFLRCLFELFLM